MCNMFGEITRSRSVRIKLQLFSLRTFLIKLSTITSLHRQTFAVIEKGELGIDLHLWISVIPGYSTPEPSLLTSNKSRMEWLQMTHNESNKRCVLLALHKKSYPLRAVSTQCLCVFITGYEKFDFVKTITDCPCEIMTQIQI